MKRSNSMKVKICLLITIFNILSINTLYSKNDLLNDMQGLSLDGDFIFELNGYVMTVNKENASIDKKKDIEKIKKSYGLKNNLREYKDPSLKWQHLVIEATTNIKDVPEAKGFQKCYLFPESDNQLRVVLMQTANGRDSLIEQSFMDAFFNRSLAQYSTDNWTAQTIDFAGRTIELGDMCNWVSPQNVHCAAFGQMSWSVFQTMQQADINTRILEAINNNSGKYKVENTENVEVLFEGIPTLAKRVTYKIKTPKILLGGRNKIAVYYITQKIRGKYVSCMLTNYIEIDGDYSLPLLLREVMSFAQ